MRNTRSALLRAARWLVLGPTHQQPWLSGSLLAISVMAQGITTTTVQGTVYLASGQPGAGSVHISWPSFTTAANQAVAAGRSLLTVSIATAGFLSVNLAPNLGASPAGLFYTAVYQLSDGSTNTEYWVVPAASSTTIAAVRSQVLPWRRLSIIWQLSVMAYVDEAIAALEGSLLTASGGTLTGHLYLCCDPTQPLEAADKHYVDSTFSAELPITGGNMTGPLGTPAINGVESPLAGTSQTNFDLQWNAAGTTCYHGDYLPAVSGTDTFTNPNGLYVADLRAHGAEQYERSVKEFGAVCDGVTDDTSALQAALNYAFAHPVALSIPQGTCKTQTLAWHGESIGGMGKQVSFQGLRSARLAGTVSLNLQALITSSACTFPSIAGSE